MPNTTYTPSLEVRQSILQVMGHESKNRSCSIMMSDPVKTTNNNSNNKKEDDRSSQSLQIPDDESIDTIASNDSACRVGMVLVIDSSTGGKEQGVTVAQNDHRSGVSETNPNLQLMTNLHE